MKLTNKLGLPDALVAAVANDDYTRGDADISVTQLIAPPQKVELERRHADELVEDAADRIWLLMGKVAHGILERAASTGVRETRLFSEIAGVKISGAFDHLSLEDGVLSDYKVTSVWSVKNAGEKGEWEQQLNAYAYLAAEAGYKVQALRIVAICRDWRMGDAAKYADDGYPQQQVAVLPQKLWNLGKTYDWLLERVTLHREAREGSLHECSAEERWEKPGGWALMKPGATRATRVLANEADARKLAAATKDMQVVFRPGVSVRCESYCAAAPFCSQFQKGKVAA
jgi:hypothetical protein